MTVIHIRGTYPQTKPVTIADPRIPEPVRAIVSALADSGTNVDVFEKYGNPRQPVHVVVACWVPWGSPAAARLRALGATDACMDSCRAMLDDREQIVTWTEPLPAVPAAFLLRRKVDVTGVSGVGDVAEGCLFADGSAVVHWRGEHATTTVHPSLDTVRAVHCHGGATEIIWP